MAVSRDVRLFDRCASERFEDATKLLECDRTTGAIYLAGYAIECILKALLLSAIPERKRDEMIETFRGRRGHHYEWLRSQCAGLGRLRFPPEINRRLSLVNDWSTDLRYSPRTESIEDAEAFLNTAAAILDWARKQF